MADEIKPSTNTPRVTPLKPARDAGRRQRPPRQPERRQTGKRDPRPDDQRPHHIDEYV
jgi:hypothetical protein